MQGVGEAGLLLKQKAPQLGRKRVDLKKPGDFTKVHALPRSGADVPDDLEARLVVLPPDHAYSKDDGNAGEAAARAILESRGNTPRLYRNTLVFLAADKVRLQDLDEAVRKYLAWSSIVEEELTLNLSPFQVRQAKTQKQAAEAAVTARLPETYQWALVPEQKSPQGPVQWNALRLTGADALAVRVSKKLRSEELFVASLGASILRKHMDDVPLWRSDHVAVRQLVEDFARYLYLPRLAAPDVLTKAISDGVSLLTWVQDSFAYAEGFDAQQGRYQGLRGGRSVAVQSSDPGMLVKAQVAHQQLETETKPAPVGQPAGGGGVPGNGPSPATPTTGQPGGKDGAPAPFAPTKVVRRFHGSVALDASRVGRDAGRIADEVVAHLVGLVGSQVRVTLEIEGEFASGVSDHVVRTVTENGRTLKFTSLGFEAE